MKNQLFFCISSLLMLFLTSCASEEFSNEESGNLSTSGGSPTQKYAGDGMYDVLGHGYNAAGEYANATSAGFEVIDVARFKSEQDARLVLENTLSQEYTEEYGENAQAYSKVVSTKVGATAGFNLFKQAIKVGFSNSVTSTNKFDAKYIYGSYNLSIKQRRFRFNATNDLLGDYLTPEFTNDLQTKTPQQIVQDYGTHVAVDIYTGAKMDIMFQSETNNQDRVRAARIGVKLSVGSIFDVNVDNDVDTAESSKNFSKKLYYRTRGGDPSKGLQGELNLDQTNPKINISNWQNSSSPSNSVLVDFGNQGLTLIYNLVKDPTKKAQLKTYVDQYLIDHGVYLDDTPIPIYRYYHPSNTDHFYSKSSVTPTGYISEGVEFYAYSFEVPNSVPIYRYYHPSNTDHFYSKSPVRPEGYISEGIEFYASSTQVSNSVPIYRYYHPSNTDHFYSKSPIRPAGYKSEGIEFYAY